MRQRRLIAVVSVWLFVCLSVRNRVLLLLLLLLDVSVCLPVKQLRCTVTATPPRPAGRGPRGVSEVRSPGVASIAGGLGAGGLAAARGWARCRGYPGHRLTSARWGVVITVPR